MNTKTNRIISIDALRGFALIGILLVNLYSFNIYYGFMREFYSEFTGANKEVSKAVMYLFGGKSMFIFAFLFGYGGLIIIKYFLNLKAIGSGECLFFS